MDEATKIKKLKEAEKGVAAEERGGCGWLSLIIGLALIVGGLVWADAMQGKTLRPNPTPIALAETAVSTSATPTLAPTATATASATSLPTGTATAVATHTPLPTQTPYPTYTPYPSATWTPQATLTPQPTWTAEPTHTAQPTYTPYPTATETAVPAVATDVPFLAPVAVESNPPGNGGDLPSWAAWLIAGLSLLLLVVLLVHAYVTRQMRPSPPPTPIVAIPDGGIPIDGTYGRMMPPPSGQPQTAKPTERPPTRPMKPLPVEEKRFRGVEPPVQPVEPTSEPVQPVQDAHTQTGQGMQIDLPLPKDRPPTAAEAAYIVQRYEELGSYTAVCKDVYGSKGGATFKFVKGAINGRYTNKQELKEVKHDPAKNRSEPTQATERRSRRPIPVIRRRGRSALN